MLCNLLGINRKIQDQITRVKYLREVWGLDQNTLAECEGLSQSSISKILQEGRFIQLDFVLDFEPSEIETLQRLPREIIPDIPLIAFVNNVLKLNPHHTFYMGFGENVNWRIAGLSSLGIQNKHLEKLFGKKQATISMIIKRNIDKVLKTERMQRYDLNMPLTFSSLPYGRF